MAGRTLASRGGVTVNAVIASACAAYGALLRPGTVKDRVLHASMNAVAAPLVSLFAVFLGVSALLPLARPKAW